MTESIGLFDTSVIVAQESHQDLDHELLPEQARISVITLAELRAGILAAPDTESRARRISSLAAYSHLSALPVDEMAAEHWARLRYRLAENRRRLNVNDLWIASIALAHDLPVVTQDDDFDVIADLGGPRLIRV